MPVPEFPTSDSTVLLPGPAGTLEARVEFPAAGEPRRDIVAVMCHPLPTEGGTMDNKVVTTTVRALHELGIGTVRFNFRGVGRSEGAWDEGRGELDDLHAVVSWVRAAHPAAQLWLGGFSFGAFVSIRASQALQPTQLISIAPPAGVREFSMPTPPQMPWLVVMGEEDEIVAPAKVYEWLADLAPPRLTLVKMPGASHFFHGKLIDLRGAIRHGVQALPAS